DPVDPREAVSGEGPSRRTPRPGQKPEPHRHFAGKAGKADAVAPLVRESPGHAGETLPEKPIPRWPPRPRHEPVQHGHCAQSVPCLREAPPPQEKTLGEVGKALRGRGVKGRPRRSCREPERHGGGAEWVGKTGEGACLVRKGPEDEREALPDKPVQGWACRSR